MRELTLTDPLSTEYTQVHDDAQRETGKLSTQLHMEMKTRTQQPLSDSTFSAPQVHPALTP